LFRNHLNSKREYLRSVAAKYDPYWDSKIVSESIGSFTRSFIKDAIEKTINSYIETEFERIKNRIIDK